MLSHKESLISAYHNYLVNDMLSPGFILGDPDQKNDFYFVADIMLPGETLPIISTRFFDSKGDFLLHLTDNKLKTNPKQCAIYHAANGFRIHYASGELLLSVMTQAYTNGYLTMIQGKLYDPSGRTRMEPSFEGVKVPEPARLVLDAPFHSRK
jgi:hypothetical protein